MKKNSSFSNIVESPSPVLLDFYGEWCGPCQTQIPILQEVKDLLGDQVKVVKIDIDKNEVLAHKFGVRSVPTLILYKDGNPVWRKSGVTTKRDLLHVIDSHS